MRTLFLCFVMISWVPSASAQNADEYQSGLLVLQDGRTISIRGHYEVFGDEVQFTYGDGRLMTLPLDRVDLEATDKRNRELQGKMPQPDELDKLDDGSIYFQVERAKRRRDSAKKGGQQNPQSGLKQINPARKAPPTQPRTQTFGPEDMEILAGKFQSRLNDLNRTWMVVLLALSLLTALFYFLSLITKLYILFKAFGDNLLWGLLLLCLGLGPMTLGIMSLLMATSGQLLPLVANITALLSIFMTVIYVAINRHGQRFKLLFLYLSPIILSVILVICFIYLGFANDFMAAFEQARP